jgi:DNA-binding beta-propeller fold protein YncE
MDSSRGLATDAHGDVYVADTGNQRIEKFSPDGHFLATWGQRGHGPGQLMYPVGVSIAPNGDIVVADDASSQYCACGPDRIEIFSPGGKFLSQWTYQNALHPILSTVTGLAVDPRATSVITGPFR